MSTSSPNREGNVENEPGRGAGAPRYYVEQAEHLRCLVRFLEAIRSVAPEVLESLRDDVGPIQGFEPLLMGLEEWAVRFHLLRPRWLGAWFIGAAYKTITDWHDEPALRDELRWGVLSGPSLTPFWAQILSATGHHAVKAMAVNLAVATRDAAFLAAAEPSGVVRDISTRDRRFKFEAPAWDEKGESREEYEKRIISGVENRLAEERSALERSMQWHAVEPAPKKNEASEHHYEWLVEHQIKKRSINKIAKDSGSHRYAVRKGIDSTAELLIGPDWKIWLLPTNNKGGRPRN